MTRFLLVLTILLLPHWASAETWYVKKSSTKLQAKASARSEVLSKLQKGTAVKVKKKAGKFFQVSTGGKTGWVFRFKLSKKAPAGGQADGDVLATLGGEQKMNARESASGSSIRGLSPISEQHARKKGATDESIQAVKNMETFKVRPEELDRFLEEGKLGEYSQ
ncbi:MAG: SH3 domain-containing protein [Nitrospinae bacterium]|nr:SH3 domain-containing protein [Nitrospinota bacterium]MBL7020645.1 SH3 domain-containing protein [Nitrospinaceae bacterium]